MSRLYLVRSDTVQDSLSMLPHPLLLRAGQCTQGCGKEISDPCPNSINPIWKFQMLYFTPRRPRKTQTEKSCEQCRAIAGGHKLKSVLQPGFSLVCKLAVSNEFWEAALLQGCSLAAGPSHAPPSTLPSQICPDVPSLSGAAPGGSAIARLACPLPFSGPKPAEPCKSLPLQTW